MRIYHAWLGQRRHLRASTPALTPPWANVKRGMYREHSVCTTTVQVLCQDGVRDEEERSEVPYGDAPRRVNGTLWDGRTWQAPLYSIDQSESLKLLSVKGRPSS